MDTKSTAVYYKFKPKGFRIYEYKTIKKDNITYIFFSFLGLMNIKKLNLQNDKRNIFKTDQ